MRAELMSFGFVVGGPHSTHFVDDREAANKMIAKVIEYEKLAGNFYDDDDFTVTEVFAKGWVGAINSEPNMMNDSWDQVYAGQVVKGVLEAVETLGEANTPTEPTP